MILTHRQKSVILPAIFCLRTAQIPVTSGGGWSLTPPIFLWQETSKILCHHAKNPASNFRVNQEQGSNRLCTDQVLIPVHKYYYTGITNIQSKFNQVHVLITSINSRISSHRVFNWCGLKAVQSMAHRLSNCNLACIFKLKLLRATSSGIPCVAFSNVILITRCSTVFIFLRVSIRIQV